MEDKYVGQVINGYEILERVGKSKTSGHWLYKMRCCRCGYVKIDSIASLKCLLNEKCIHPQKIFDNPRIGDAFRAMVRRCYHKEDPDYRFWGAKGITICDEWLSDNKKFEDWALANGYADDLTIDRIDCSRPYEPSNCRWVTLSENAKWKSTTNVITVNGITDSGRGWSNRLGCGVNRVNRMIRENGLEETKKWIATQIA